MSTPGTPRRGESDHDVRQQLAGLWYDMAGTPFPSQILTLVHMCGSAHVVYGSDYCWTPPAGVDAQLRSVDDAEQPPGDDWRSLTTRNARALMGKSKQARQ